MSAFLCSDYHFQVIADVLAEAADNVNHKFNYAVTLFLEDMGFDRVRSFDDARDQGIAAANRLYVLNELALAGRYGDELSEHKPVKTVKFKGLFIDDIAAYKAFTCLLYQCCEDGAIGTEDYKHLNTLINRMACAIVAHLPKYDAAPWGIDEPADLPDQHIIVGRIA